MAIIPELKSIPNRGRTLFEGLQCIPSVLLAHHRVAGGDGWIRGIFLPLLLLFTPLFLPLLQTGV